MAAISSPPQCVELCAGNLPMKGGFRSKYTSDAEPWWFLWCLRDQSLEQTAELPMILISMMLIWHHCNVHDLFVITYVMGFLQDECHIIRQKQFEIQSKLLSNQELKSLQLKDELPGCRQGHGMCLEWNWHCPTQKVITWGLRHFRCSTDGGVVFDKENRVMNSYPSLGSLLFMKKLMDVLKIHINSNRSHTHTHIYIHIYIYIWSNTSLSKLRLQSCWHIITVCGSISVGVVTFPSGVLFWFRSCLIWHQTTLKPINQSTA